MWKWDVTNNFSVKLAYSLINDERCRLPFAKQLWKTRCPLKIRILFLVKSKKSNFNLGQPLEERVGGAK